MQPQGAPVANENVHWLPTSNKATTGEDDTGGNGGSGGGTTGGPTMSGPPDELVTRRELELTLIAVVESLNVKLGEIRSDIAALNGRSLHRWEFWIAILAVILTMFYGTWSASQTAAQNGITLNQGMNDAANRAAERAREEIVRELDRRDGDRN